MCMAFYLMSQGSYTWNTWNSYLTEHSLQENLISCSIDIEFGYMMLSGQLNGIETSIATHKYKT